MFPVTPQVVGDFAPRYDIKERSSLGTVNWRDSTTTQENTTWTCVLDGVPKSVKIQMEENPVTMNGDEEMWKGCLLHYLQRLEQEKNRLDEQGTLTKLQVESKEKES